MLTYSLSFNRDISIPPLQKIVSAKIVESLWDAKTCIPEQPREVREMEYWRGLLDEHRKQTIDASIALMKENNLPSIFKAVFEESVLSRCRANCQVLRWKLIYDPRDEMFGRVKAFLLDTRRYLAVNGEFDDLAWTKRVLLDPLRPIVRRFELACYYCLESEIAVLWSEMKNSSSVPHNGDLHEMFRNLMSPIVVLWICELENRLDELALNPQFLDLNVYEEVFEEAVFRKHEHASRYFWGKMEGMEKIEGDFVSFTRLICNTDEKVAVFFYSQMSKKQKQKFLDLSIKKGVPDVWVKLLLSPYTEAECSEIIEMVYKLPFQQYSHVLEIIAGSTVDEFYSFHRKGVFEALWIHLSPEDRVKVLKRCPYMICKSLKVNRLDFVDYVVKGLSLEQIENISIFWDTGMWVRLADALAIYRLR